MQLTNSQVQELYRALTLLDGKGEGEKQIQYKFSGPTLLKLARNLHALRQPALDVQDVIGRRHRDIINGYEKPPLDMVRAFEEEITIMLKQAEDYKLITLTEDELNLNENSIPPSVLAGIIPILE
jgi:hypothetical protein